jgi:NAD(P)-dependent dehydrogenase (short-subunit alcohol dehydrogenase family)
MARVLSPTQIDSVLQQTPLARLGTPEEISELACFLLSERASFIVGQTISACGGRVTLP